VSFIAPEGVSLAGLASRDRLSMQLSGGSEFAGVGFYDAILEIYIFSRRPTTSSQL
jgi:hypothetical protein